MSVSKRRDVTLSWCFKTQVADRHVFIRCSICNLCFDVVPALNMSTAVAIEDVKARIISKLCGHCRPTYYRRGPETVNYQALLSHDGTTVATGGYVSICPENLDSRRTGNQLFVFAALLYVARLTNRTVAMPTGDVEWSNFTARVRSQRRKRNWLNETFELDVDGVDVPRMSYDDLCPCYTFRERHELQFD